MEHNVCLIEKARKVLQSFDPAVHTVDTHVAKTLGASFSGDAEAVFVQQVFYGCTRMEKPLQVFLNALYHVHASSLVRTDYTLFKLFAYLAVFRMDELTVPRFLGLVRTQELSKMHNFLSFTFDESIINDWVKEGWCKTLDRGYVEGTMMGSLRRNRSLVQRWLEDTHAAAFGAGTQASLADSLSPKKSSQPLTVPRPPKLTAPKQPKVLMPYRIPQGITPSPVPDNIDDVTLGDLELRAAHRREALKAQTLAKYDRERDAFKLHETRNTIDAARKRQEELIEQQMIGTFKSGSVPKYSTVGADVRLNAAAVLREEALLRAKQAADAKLIAEFEACRRDKSDYYTHIAEAKLQEDAERAATIEQRRKEMVVASKRAGAARMKHREMKAAQAHLLQEEAQMLLEARQAEKEADVEAKREMVAAVEQMKAVGTKAAKDSILARNRIFANTVQHEAKAAELERAEERAKELAERNETIREIRAYELVPKIKLKFVDPTSTSGMGFLDEMSLVELRERLAILKARDAEEVENKRRHILAVKSEQAEKIAEKVSAIVKQRAQAAAINEEAREAKAKLIAESKAEIERRREQAAVELLGNLEARKAQQANDVERLKNEQAEIAKRNMFLGAEKSAVEERRIASVFQAQQRRAQLDRSNALADFSTTAAIAQREEAAARKRVKEEHEAKVDAERRAAGLHAASAQQAKDLQVAELAAKKEGFIAATEWRSTLFDLRDERDPYTAAVRKKEQDDARTMRRAATVEEEKVRAISARMSRVPADNPLRQSLSMRLTSRLGAVVAR